MEAYLGSLEWWKAAVWGEEFPLRRKELVRCRVAADGADSGETVLTLPIVGGASALKREAPDTWRLSDHGNWPHVHCGALEAAYSRTPYFRHYADPLLEALANPPVLVGELTAVCARWVRDSLRMEETLPQLKAFITEKPELAARIREDIGGKVRPQLSVADALFRLGPDAIFAFIPAFINEETR